jgi:hypothetical protein
VTASDPLPPLVLRCRPVWRLAFGGTAILLLGMGAGVLATPGPSEARWTAIVLFAFGAGCAHFFLRHCLARLSLDDRGFTIRGPLSASRAVAWDAVVDWERARVSAGPAALRIVHGAGRERLSVPLIYEDCHLLEVGLLQRRFPDW